MTKLSRKLLISVFTLAFALVTLGATTFAWFTLTSTAAIDTMNMDITAGHGIEISVDGNNYKNQITLAEIKQAILSDSDGNFKELDSATSPDGTQFFAIDGTTPSENYVEFKLYFRSPTEDAEVYLTTDTFTQSTEKTWVSDTTFAYRGGNTVNAGTQVKIYAANALRFSFEEYSDVFTTKKAGTSPLIFELGDNTTEGNDTNIPLGSTPDLDKGLVKYWAEKKNGENITTDKTIVLPAGVKNRSSGLGLTDGDPTLPIVKLETKGTGDDSNFYSYAQVRIWLEGWDPDNFDALLDSSLSIRFAFAVTAAPVIDPED